MSPIAALTQLLTLEYSISLDGGSLEYVYHGEDPPPGKKAIPLLKALKAHIQKGWKPEDHFESLALEKERQRVFREANRRLRGMIKEAGETYGKRTFNNNIAEK